MCYNSSHLVQVQTAVFAEANSVYNVRSSNAVSQYILRTLHALHSTWRGNHHQQQDMFDFEREHTSTLLARFRSTHSNPTYCAMNGNSRHRTPNGMVWCLNANANGIRPAQLSFMRRNMLFYVSCMATEKAWSLFPPSFISKSFS
jgi:hypothetical protein